MNHDRNQDHAPQDRMTDADEREWLAQERALRDERARTTAGNDPALAAYRTVVRALRTPLPDALPADFAESMAARCRGASMRVDTWLEQQFQRVLLLALAASTLAVCARDGGEWLRASVAALPLLDQATTLNWSAALVACLGLSWAMGVIGRRAAIR
jgi:hypothetical protein